MLNQLYTNLKSANSKKLYQIFFNLYGQTPHLWTNWGNKPNNCPNIRFFRKYLEVLEIIPTFAPRISRDRTMYMSCAKSPPA